MEKKILLIPIIYMLISAVCFASDVYFFINHKKNLEDMENNNGGIIFMHFLIVSKAKYVIVSIVIAFVCVYSCVYVSICIL